MQAGSGPRFGEPIRETVSPGTFDARNDLISAPIRPLIVKLAVPVSTGFFFNTLFNITDTYFAGRGSPVGLAAISITFPLFFVIIALGVGIATGTTTLIGNALGAGERDEARAFALQSVSFAVIHAVLLAATGYAAAPLLFRALGADGEYLEQARTYMNVIFGGTVFMITNHVLSAILTASGDTKSFRNFLIAGSLLNILFDPWFMFGGWGMPALGLRGVALATVLIHAAGTVYLVGRVRRSPVVSGCCTALLVPRNRMFLSLARQGMPATLNTLTIAAGMFVITWFISFFGSDVVAAYGIGSRVVQFALLPMVGLNVATLTLTAQNSGGRRFDRVRETVRNSLIWGVAVTVLSTAVVSATADRIVHLFTTSPAIAAEGVRLLRIESLTYGAYMILYITVSVLQGLKRPVFPVVIGLYRQLAAPALVFTLLLFHWGTGVDGIWWGICGVNWSAALVSIGYLRYLLRRLPR